MHTPILTLLGKEFYIEKPTIFAELPTFSGVPFFGFDEMHAIAHGIGRHIFELFAVNLNSSNDSNIYYVNESKVPNVQSYTFKLDRADIKTIGECIEQSRATIPTSFQGGWDNPFFKVEGFRAVDWLDLLLHAYKCVVIPFIKRKDVRQALLSLIHGCDMALHWRITENMRRNISR